MMILKTIKSTIMGISFLLLLTTCSKKTKVEETFMQLCDQYEVPAAAFFIIENDRHHFLFHGKNKDGKPTNANTVFEAASLSKVVFYTLLEKEFNNRKLSLDSPLSSFGLTKQDLGKLNTQYPNAPRLSMVNPICLNASVRDVSNHISGIDDGKPGVFSYSESGYLLLQLLLEKITSRNIQALYTNHLNFENMSFIWDKSNDDNSVDGFLNKNTKERKIRNHTQGFSNGTLTSSIKGLSMFCELLLIQPSGKEKVSIESYPTLYWTKGRGGELVGNNRSFQWHYGSNYCFNSFILINLKEKKAYGILTNSVSAKQLMQPLFSSAINEDHLFCFDYIKWY